MRPYSRGNIMYYDYPYGFSSQEEESDYEKGNIASGKILDTDPGRMLIKIKLMKSYNPNGVILYDTHCGQILYKDESYDELNRIIPADGRQVFYMKEGDEYWFHYEDDYWEPGD